MLFSDASIEHIASYVAPQPLQQIHPSGKKIIGDSSSQKLSTAEVSSDFLTNLVDIVIDRVVAHHAELAKVAFDLRNQLMKCYQANLIQDAAFEKAKESVWSQAPLLMLLAPSEQGVRTSTKRKSLEVEEEVDLTASLKGAKPFGRKFIKTAAKKAIVEVNPDPSILKVEPLDEDLNNTNTLSNLMRKVDKQKQVLSGIIEAQEALEAEDQAIAKKYKEAKKFAKLAVAALQAKTQIEDAKQLAAAFKAKSEAEEAERKRLEAEEEKKRQADKAEEERVAEIARRLEMKKKEKAQADWKRQQELERKKKEEEQKKEVEVAKRQAKQLVPGVAKLTKPTVMAPVVSVLQPAIEVRTSIEAATSSIEAAAPLVSVLFTLIFALLASLLLT